MRASKGFATALLLVALLMLPGCFAAGNALRNVGGTAVKQAGVKIGETLRDLTLGTESSSEGVEPASDTPPAATN
jgi:hypothetical protein